MAATSEPAATEAPEGKLVPDPSLAVRNKSMRVVAALAVEGAGSPYAVYQVETTWGPCQWSVFRRYNDFDLLQAVLGDMKGVDKARLKGLKFPGKAITQRNKFDEKFLEGRRVGFETWLTGVYELLNETEDSPAYVLDDFLTGDWDVTTKDETDVREAYYTVAPIALFGLYPESVRAQAYVFKADGGSIGSKRTNVVSIQDDRKSLSRTHARVAFSTDTGQYYICDMGSANGTSITGRMGNVKLEPFVPALLAPGSIVHVGAVLQFVVESRPAHKPGPMSPVMGAAQEGIKYDTLTKGSQPNEVKNAKFSGWEKRYCVLQNDALLYYNPKNLAVPRGYLPLVAIDAICPTENPKAPAGVGAFDIKTQARTDTLHGTTAEESASWQAAIEEAWRPLPKKKTGVQIANELARTEREREEKEAKSQRTKEQKEQAKAEKKQKEEEENARKQAAAAEKARPKASKHAINQDGIAAGGSGFGGAVHDDLYGL